MISAKAMQAASDLLWGHWNEGTVVEALPPEMRPATRQEGYAIQALLMQRASKPLFGWKIAATSKAGQQHINVDGPLAGRILAERVVPAGSTIRLAANRMRVAEAEMCFRMGRDLPPRPEPHTEAEVLDAIGHLHLAIEVPDSRYTDFTKVGAAQLIADDACAHQFTLGPVAAGDWRGMDLATLEVVGAVTGRGGRSLVHRGKGANVLGGPLIAMTWLVNELSGLGITLKAGEVVTTGTCVVPMPLEPGDTVSADFGPLGKVGLAFA